MASQLLALKTLLGLVSVSGISISGAYFGTKTTVGSWTSSSLFKNSEQKDWTKCVQELKKEQTQDYPKSDFFKNLKKEVNDDSKWERLKITCEEIYDWTDKAFGISFLNGNLSEDITKYCFKTDNQ